MKGRENKAGNGREEPKVKDELGCQVKTSSSMIKNRWLVMGGTGGRIEKVWGVQTAYSISV